MVRKPVSDAVDVGRTVSDAGGPDEWCYGNGLLHRAPIDTPAPAARATPPLPGTATVRSGPDTSAAPDCTSGSAGSNPSIPPLEAGEAIRFHDSRGSIRFLWPTDDATAHPFVGVLAGTEGSRYPLYLDRDVAAAHCRASYSIVATESIPIDPPPHALNAAANDGRRFD